MSKLVTSQSGVETLVQLTPPQTIDNEICVAKGAYCFVIDVSGSMNSSAAVTTDDGDKVDHGWSLLDIAKHSTNTFISSLEDFDYVCIVTYSDGASVILPWTQCSRAGREVIIAKVHTMRHERSTNLMAGITTGFSQINSIPVTADELEQYSINLIVTTDGMPSAQWHPARGRDGYAKLVDTLNKQVVRDHGECGKPSITTIGLGNQLDSDLLVKMSDKFLHIPDPGAVGPFMVNLLAALRCTATLPEVAEGCLIADHVTLLVSPASALEGTPGYTAPGLATKVGDVMRLKMGSVLLDQPRHIVLLTKEPNISLKIELEVQGSTVMEAEASGTASEAEITVQHFRLKAVSAIQKALQREGDTAPLTELIAEMDSSAVAGLPLMEDLRHTLESEVILGCDAENFHKWGQHYMRTLPLMLLAERRSNFRDRALQTFGQDAQGREARFEEQSNNSEMIFATLKPPEPSLRPRPNVNPGQAGADGATPQPQESIALPEEFMRGGGCFAPEGKVLRMCEGETQLVRVDQVMAGDLLLSAAGLFSRVRCVVRTPCKGGRALFSRLPSGLEITEWHPVQLEGGRWHFPLMLGQRVCRPCAAVYNLVLESNHTIVINGVRACTLGHGFTEDIVAHEYWGSNKVIDKLRSHPGWSSGRVELDAELIAH